MTLDPQVQGQIDAILVEKDVKASVNTAVPESETIKPVPVKLTKFQLLVIALLAWIAASALEDKPEKVKL